MKFTGKERDAETGLDYFGARYFSAAQGRWTSPDWSASPQPVPYSKLDNPQSLNLYGYVLNNPMSRRDDDGHEIIYADGLKNSQVVKDTVTAILANRNTSSTLSGYVGKGNPDLYIFSGDLSKGDKQTTNADGTVTTTRVLGNTDGGGQTTDGVTTQGSAIITVDNRNTLDDLPHTLVHEAVHAGEARQDINKFVNDAKAEAANPNHDTRPQEERAIAADRAYSRQIAKEAKQIAKDRKKDGAQ
jgi:RHS repeat-associated protein